MTSSHASPDRAELDDQPYGDLIHRVRAAAGARWAGVVINSPFTRWEADDIHGRRPILTSVWVNLDVLFPWPADAPRHVTVTGLDLTGVAPGRPHGRFPSMEGDWYGIVNHGIGYADGRHDKLHLVDQFVPFTALRERK